MSGGKLGSFEGINWGKHVPHAATAIVLERALEFLLGGHGSDFSEIRSQLEDIKWGPFHRAELNIKLWKTLRSDPHHSKAREKELLIEAYDCFHQSASVLKDEKRCEVLIAASSCAQYIGWYSEANAIRDIAREELRSVNESLFRDYKQKLNVTKRIINSNVRVSKSELGVVSGLLVLASAACPPLALSALAAGSVIGTATAVGRMTDDHERITERLSATQRVGVKEFGGKWYGPRTVRRGIWTLTTQPTA